jgi:hypothetical protein
VNFHRKNTYKSILSLNLVFNGFYKV